MNKKDRTEERLDELVKLNQVGAAGAKPPSWASGKKKGVPKFRKGGMVKGQNRDYCK